MFLHFYVTSLSFLKQIRLLLGHPSNPLAACPGEKWVPFQGKCYYFSEANETWIYSQKTCSSLNASLAGIDTRQEWVSPCSRDRPGLAW
uniref:C-type lectin domain-containing protein n=1 Tax=Pelusios castaneus TaxID=367368 RepID=A0A8C8S8X5_9SAUR